MQNIDTIVTVLHTSDLLFCNSNDYFFSVEMIYSISFTTKNYRWAGLNCLINFVQYSLVKLHEYT